MEFLLAFAAVAVFACAGVGDVRSRTISNRTVAALLALAMVRIGLDLLGGAALEVLGVDVAVALAVFIAGSLFFAFGLFGGGDVKLLAAGALWLGAGAAADFLLITVVSGGALALVYLLRGLVLRMRRGRSGAAATLPYGVAIAAAGIFLSLARVA